MKKVFRCIVGIDMVILVLFGCSGCTNMTYKQDVIYTEDKLEGYNKNNQTEGKKGNIGRDEAIEKALNIFNEGFEKDLNRGALYESIELSNKGDDDFFWQILFEEKKDEKKSGEFYYVSIDVEYGYVKEVIIDQYNDKNIQYYQDDAFKVDDVKEKIEKVAKSLDIDISNDDIYIKDNIVQIINLKEGLEKYEFEVDQSSGKIVRYYRIEKR